MYIYTSNVFTNHRISVEKANKHNIITTKLYYLETGPLNALSFSLKNDPRWNISSSEMALNWLNDL